MPEVVISPVANGLTLARAALTPPDSALRGSLYSKGKRQNKAGCRMLPLFQLGQLRTSKGFPMNREPISAKEIFLKSAASLAMLVLLLGTSGAQTAQKKSAASNESRSPEQELVRTETGFFEAWKSKDAAYLREHMTENGVFWGEYGTFSREQQLAEQQESAKACAVQGYQLSDFGALPLTAGVYLLTYKAEQYATCNGEKVPVHMNGSSVYIFKGGRWLAIYRAEVPLKNPS